MLTKLKTLLNKFFSKVEDYSDDFWPDSGSMSWADTKYDLWAVPEKEVKLTQGQIQYLIDTNRKKLYILFEMTAWYSHLAKREWSHSDKETTSGQESFSMLNLYRDIIRDNKTEIEKLSEIQSVLKKLRSQV